MSNWDPSDILELLRNLKIEFIDPFKSEEDVLKHLAENHNDLNIQEYPSLTSALVQHIADCTHLTSLFISNFSLDDSKIEILAKSKSITELDITYNDISDNALKYLATNSTLKILEAGNDERYSRAMITDTGAYYISQSTSITSLDLSGQNITDKGAQLLALCFNLKVLSIEGEIIDNMGPYVENYGKITDEGASAFLTNLKLLDLHLAGNQISEECLEKLEHHIEKNNLPFENEPIIQKNYMWGSKFKLFGNTLLQPVRRTFATDVDVINNG